MRRHWSFSSRIDWDESKSRSTRTQSSERHFEKLTGARGHCGDIQPTRASSQIAGFNLFGPRAQAEQKDNNTIDYTMDRVKRVFWLVLVMLYTMDRVKWAFCLVFGSLWLKYRCTNDVMICKVLRAQIITTKIFKNIPNSVRDNRSQNNALNKQIPFGRTCVLW